MYTIEIHNRIDQIISMFYFIGLWHDPERNIFFKRLLSIWHVTVYAYYPFALGIGAYHSDNETETVFLVVMSIVTSVGAMRLYYFVVKKDEILKFIRKLGVHEVNNSEKEFQQVNNKINFFIRFATYYEVTILGAVMSLIIIALPIFSAEKRFPFNIYIPLDWRNNELHYWIVYTFVSYEAFMTVMCTLFNVIIWYLMMAIVFEYEILGSEFKNVGWITSSTTDLSKTFSDDERQDLFFVELTSLIKKHRNLQKETMHFKSFFSKLFMVQMATSGLGICGSVLALAFSSAKNPVNYGVYVISLLYCIFDIFMVTYFGNEIKLNSSKLSYGLFRCNWMDQSKSSKKCVVVLMEILKRPDQLVIGIFPLDLELFTNILNLAYRMFNVIRA